MAEQFDPLWFRVPVETQTPPLISESIGFQRIVARPADGFRMQVGVFDSPGARLLRAGIVVAHRRSDDDPGEWYLSAPSWPGLPDEATFEVGQERDLPPEVRRKLALFLRDAPLAPFATMECVRREYSLRGPEETVADIRDDLVTIVRDGTTTSEQREITLQPRVQLSGQQRDFIRSAFDAIDGEELERPPSLQERLGPPASGLGIFREPAELRKDMSLEEFVSESLLGHLTRLVDGELTEDAVVIRGELNHLLDDLRGLSSELAPQWRERLESDVRSLLSKGTEDREPALLSTIEGLIAGMRAPQLGDHAGEQARVVLYSRIRQQLLIVFDRCRALEADGPDEAWSAVLRQAEYLDAAVRLVEPLFGKHARRLREAVGEVISVLRTSVRPPADIELVGMSPKEAFQLGRDVEHAQWSVDRARRHFLQHWPEYVGAGRKALKKMGKKLR